MSRKHDKKPKYGEVIHFDKEEPKFPPIRIITEGSDLIICKKCNQQATEVADSGMCKECFINWIILEDSPIFEYLQDSLKEIENDLKIMRNWWIFGCIYVVIKDFIKNKYGKNKK